MLADSPVVQEKNRKVKEIKYLPKSSKQWAGGAEGGVVELAVILDSFLLKNL